MLMDCVRPYLSLLPYADCKGPTERSFDFETQYLAVLTMCRHALDFRFMAFLLGISDSTMQRIGNAWIIFLATIFNRIDLKPEHGFLIEKMPSSFIETGHGLTDIVLDATEFKFNFATNYDVNSLMFSHTKIIPLERL